MIRYTSVLTGAKISASDGELGHVEELYFDDETWTVRYLVIDTAPLFFGKKVLISPFAVTNVDWKEGTVELDLTQQQMKESPEINTTLPVSREKELMLSKHYGWPPYWAGDGLWGFGADPANTMMIMKKIEKERQEKTEAENLEPGENHLRSSKEVSAYSVQAGDEEVGSVADFAVDEQTWKIRYVLVKTGTLFNQDTTAIASEWIESVNWRNASISVRIDPELIRSAPEIIPPDPIKEEYEKKLHDHYRKSGAPQ